MSHWGTQSRLAPRLVDSLYVEAMVLADEVRGYFDGCGIDERDALPPLERVRFSCESLKTTTRLMQIVSWLLMRRAIEAGEVETGRSGSAIVLGEIAESSDSEIGALPETARMLIGASRELYHRIRRMDHIVDPERPPPSPALSLLSRLERAF